MSRETLRRWWIGAIGAAINSAAGAGALIIVDPLEFDPFGPGLMKLVKVSVALALVGAFLYIRQHPLPIDEP
jgi:hypothetical protein